MAVVDCSVSVCYMLKVGTADAGATTCGKCCYLFTLTYVLFVYFFKFF